MNHLGVGKTRLLTLRATRNVLHCVHEFTRPLHISAVAEIVARMRVNTVCNAPFEVIFTKVEAILTVLKNRGEGFIELTDRAALAPSGYAGSIVANEKIFLQKSINAIKDTARTVTDNCQLFGGVSDRIPLNVVDIFLNVKVDHTLTANHLFACDRLDPTAHNFARVLLSRGCTAFDIIFQRGKTAK